MPSFSQHRSEPSDSAWFWSMAAVFAFVAIFPERVPHGLKVGLVTALIVDSVGACIVLYYYSKLDFLNNAFDLFLATSGAGMVLIVLFAFLGQDLYAALALISVVRCGCDVYVYIRTPPEESHSHARKYFGIFLQAALLIAGIVLFALVAPEVGDSIRRDENFLACETDACRLTSSPDLFILFGLFMYPLIGWLTFKWQPQWMRWVPAPKHLQE